MPFAEVAVNAAAPLKQTFTYRVPEGMDVLPGQAVYVPFGSRTLQGIVMRVGEEAGYPDARDIEAVIDPRPLLSLAHIELAFRLCEHYLAPLFDCVSLMLPPGWKQRPLTVLRPLVREEELPALRLTERQERVLRYLLEAGEATAEELARKGRISGAAGAVSALLTRGFVQRSYRLARPGAAPKVVPNVRLLIDVKSARAQVGELRASGAARAGLRAAVLDLLAREAPLPLSQARAGGLTPALLRDLQAEGVIAVEDVPVMRDPLAGRSYARAGPPPLTEAQEAALEEIAAPLHGRGRPAAYLLHGVTGSGKTEVYLAALDRLVAAGKRAIVLVPEISLTPQTVRRFAERFPERVAVMHSALSPGEHFDMWHAIRDGRYDVVVGPRGALFAPQPDLGMVIIDEEHEWTYKQHDASPRYHARRAAEELCRLTSAALVLGSATPDIESHFRAQEGPYRLLELPERLIAADGGVRPAPLPHVDVVDLREELKAGNRSIFSRRLSAAIRAALGAREQVILFLNRRGTASFVQCRDCGFVPQCRSCSVALTYHEPEMRLICHYCRRGTPPPLECPICKGIRIRTMGLGTERVEAEAQKAFPRARTLRWDRDVTRGRDSHEAILARFLAHEADILIGTQMVAKGLDIPLVTLVGVISADISLHLPDFRAGERTFQLLEQVAGRAGRGPKGGQVIIQTYTPEHHSIEAAAAHDYHSLYERETGLRRRLGYPPFGRLVRMTYAHTGERYAQEQAAELARKLKQKRDRLGLPNLDILGPSPAFVARIRGRWRWNLLLRGADPAALLRDEPLPRGWTVDVDPVSVL
jgi:primosomal protein N' (replication factor Y)